MNGEHNRSVLYKPDMKISDFFSLLNTKLSLHLRVIVDAASILKKHVSSSEFMNSDFVKTLFQTLTVVCYRWRTRTSVSRSLSVTQPLHLFKLVSVTYRSAETSIFLPN